MFYCVFVPTHVIHQQTVYNMVIFSPKLEQLEQMFVEDSYREQNQV